MRSDAVDERVYAAYLLTQGSIFKNGDTMGDLDPAGDKVDPSLSPIKVGSFPIRSSACGCIMGSHDAAFARESTTVDLPDGTVYYSGDAGGSLGNVVILKHAGADGASVFT